MIITADILKAIAPGSKITNYTNLDMLALWMNDWFPKFEIDTKPELCHFIAQAAHETDSFNALTEYASGDAYDTRTDLGNTPQKDGDGRKYKGRGIFQITGLLNYRQATLSWAKYARENGATCFDFQKDPQLLARPQFAVWSACQFWEQRDLNTFANMPDNALIFVRKLNKNVSPLEYISWRVNGSLKTVPERKLFYDRTKQIIK